MDRDSYIEGIRGAWLGEQFGEAFFKGLAARAKDSAMQRTWLTLARLEQVTGKTMATLLEAHGEPATSNDPVEIGEEMLSQYSEVSHLQAMTKMKGVVEPAIVHFDQLLAVAPESDVPAVQFLVQHEQALLTFVDREIAGDHDHALEDVEALLAQAASATDTNAHS